MRISKVMTIFWKEYDDVLKSRYILLTMIFMPFFMLVILPMITYIPIIIDPQGLSNDDFEFFLRFKLTENWDSLDIISQYFIIFVEFNWLYYFIIPILLPSVIAADSFSGEKDRGTVEGLIAAPLTETELYVGKITTSLFPTVLSVWIYSIPYVIITNVFSNRILGYNYLPNLRFFILVFFVIPLATVISINIMIWASTKTNNSRDAQQLGSLILLPLMILLLNIVVLGLTQSNLYIFLGGLVLLVLSVFAIKFGVAILDRERWLASTS